MLGVEHDCSEVFVSAGCIPQEVCTPLHVGGCRGDFSPLWGSRGPIPPDGGSWGQGSLGRGFKGSAPEAKNRFKISL